MSRAKYQLLPSNENASGPEDEQSSQTPINNHREAQPVNPETNLTTTVNTIAQDQLQEISLNQEIHVQPTAQNVEMGSTPVGESGNQPSLAELPSYNEAVRLKKLEVNSNDLPPAYFPQCPDQTRFPIDPCDVSGLVDDPNAYDQDIGSECMFLSAFMIAFFFNWIGFFASICLLPNAAGKYGALSGFGLSMAKWVTIVRYQEWMTNMNDFQQKLFFWLFIFLGFYLFFRGLINYMTLKYRPIASVDYSRQSRWLTFLD